MRGSAKGDEPPELRDWKAEQRRNGIEPEYRNLQDPERGATEKSLFAEQTGQCVYCGREISLDRKQHYHREHFRPQAKYPDLQLDYTNLFLSCGPDGDREARNSCGHYKGNWFDEDCHIPPVPEVCTERFRFRSSGHIFGDGSPEANKMIGALNLNHHGLVKERRDMIEALDDALNNGALREVLIQDFLYVDPNGARPSFANVAVAYLGA